MALHAAYKSIPPPQMNGVNISDGWCTDYTAYHTQQPASQLRGKAKEKRESQLRAQYTFHFGNETSMCCEPQDRSSSAPFAVWLVRFQVCYYMTLYTFLQLSTVCNSRIYVTMNVFS